MIQALNTSPINRHSENLKYPSQQCCNPFRRLVRCLRKEKNELAQSVTHLANKNIRMETKAKTNAVLNAIKSLDFSSLKNDIIRIIQDMTDLERKDLLETALNDDFHRNEKYLGNQCLGLMTLEQMRALSKHVHNEFETTQKTAKELAQISQAIKKYDVEELRQQLQKNSKQFILFKLISNLFRTIAVAFNLLNLGKEPSTYFETKYMLDIYWRIIEIPVKLIRFLFDTILNPLRALLVLVLGSIVSAITTFILTKFFNRCPDELPDCINLINQIKEGLINPTFGRDEELAKIMQTLAANNDTGRKHPLLVGHSGIGKTELMKALAWKLANNDVPDALKNKKIFYVNSAELIKKQSPFALKDPLEMIKEKIGKYRKDVILVFDESDDLADTFGTRFNSLLDTSPESFYYVIGITTPDQYKKIAEKSLDRRFTQIQMKEPSEEQTCTILRDMRKREANDIYVPKEILKSIYEQTKDRIPKRSQPDKSILVLSQALEKVRHLQNGGDHESERQKLLAKKEKISSELSTEKIHGVLTQNVKNLSNQLNEINKNIEEMTNLIESRKKIAACYRDYKRQLEWHEKWLHQTSESITTDADKGKKIPEILEKLYLFNNFFLIPQLDKHINDYVQTNHIPVEVNEVIVKQVIDHLSQQENSPVSELSKTSTLSK